MTIKFDRNSFKKTITSINKPVLYIDRIVFLTDDKNWINRLFSASLIIKFACIDSNKRERKTHQEPLVFSAFITAYHRQPVMEVNRLFSFEDTINITDDNACNHWKTTIELNNLTIGQNELLEISITDKELTLKRIKDWQKRVKNLYAEIKHWLPSQCEVKDGAPTSMFEEMMQIFNINPVNIETIDLFKGNKFLMSFKPKGLWIIGANGRIDIISRKGSFILLDNAVQFNVPQWHIYTLSGKQIGKPFIETEFLKLIDLLQ